MYALSCVCPSGIQLCATRILSLLNLSFVFLVGDEMLALEVMATRSCVFKNVCEKFGGLGDGPDNGSPGSRTQEFELVGEGSR